MPITLWTYVPPITGAIIVALLIIVLRRLLRLPSGAVLALAKPTRCAESEHERAWHAIANHWGERVAGLLATSIGASALIITIWALAYVGWTTRYCMGHVSNPPVLPPWFGSPLDVLAFAAIGMLATIVVLFALAIFLGAAWFVGTCLLWPESCGTGEDESSAEGRRP